jgi:hypothetical protein
MLMGGGRSVESFEFTNDTPAVDVASLWQDYLKSKSASTT